MKTAVLITGRMEKEDIYRVENLMDQIIIPYKADVFIDSWIPYKGVSHKLATHRVHDEFNDIDPEFPAFDVDEFAEKYQPKMMCLDHFDAVPLTHQIRLAVSKLPLASRTLEGGVVSHRKENVFFMWYKIYKANRLRKLYEELNRVRYDRIIRTRFDSNFAGMPVIEPEPKTIYVPNCGDYEGGLNDQFAMGDSQAMDMYCDLYMDIYRYITLGVSQHPESMLRVHMEINRLNIARFECEQYLRGIRIPSDPALTNGATITQKILMKIREKEKHNVIFNPDNSIVE